MTVHLIIKDANGSIIESHKTESVATADLIARALAFQHPDADVEIAFKPL